MPQEFGSEGHHQSRVVAVRSGSQNGFAHAHNTLRPENFQTSQPLPSLADQIAVHSPVTLGLGTHPTSSWALDKCLG